MKTSTLIGISLTLLMLLLVLLAGFVFLYQGRLDMEKAYQADLDALTQQQAETDLRLTNVEGTRTAVEQVVAQQTTVIASLEEDNANLEQESVSSLQTVEALQLDATRLSVALINAESTREAIQADSLAILEQPSVIEILSPADGDEIIRGEDVQFIIAARDTQGIATIQLLFNTRVIATETGDGVTFITYKHKFPLSTVGSQLFEAQLINVNDGTTMATPVQVTVVAAEN